LKLWVVGLGPGDPELLTIKAVNVLHQAKLIFAPFMGDSPKSRAYEVVKYCLLPDARIVFVPFKPEPQEVSERIMRELKKEPSGEGVFLVIGDPTLYSSFFKIFSGLMEDINLEVEIVPGISSFQLLSSCLKLPLAQGQETISVAPLGASPDKLKILFDNSDTLILCKMAHLEQVDSFNLSCFSKKWVGENLGTKKERIYAFQAFPSELPYFSLILLKR